MVPVQALSEDEDDGLCVEEGLRLVQALLDRLAERDVVQAYITVIETLFNAHTRAACVEKLAILCVTHVQVQKIKQVPKLCRVRLDDALGEHLGFGTHVE
jgi:hypothetical protein